MVDVMLGSQRVLFDWLGSKRTLLDWLKRWVILCHVAFVLTFKNVQEVSFTLYSLGHFLLQELSTLDRKLFTPAVRSS